MLTCPWAVALVGELNGRLGRVDRSEIANISRDGGSCFRCLIGDERITIITPARLQLPRMGGGHPLAMVSARYLRYTPRFSPHMILWSWGMTLTMRRSARTHSASGLRVVPPMGVKMTGALMSCSLSTFLANR